MTNKTWTDAEIETLARMYRRGDSIGSIARGLGRSFKSVENRVFVHRQDSGMKREILSQSPARVWNDHITIEGDTLVLPDVEAPYHHADFINRCIDLAQAWKIDQVVLAGDFVHFANFSAWGAEFKGPSLPASADAAIMELVDMLPLDRRGAAIARLEQAQIITPDMGISAEIGSVRQTVREVQSAFEHVYYIMGNHEQRKLRSQDYGEDPNELLRFFGADAGKWTVSPYYWCNIKTESPYLYRIEHPRPASRAAAQDLAVQYQQHIIMGHSHRWAMNRDLSGRLYAIQAGHCVDETRLAYVMQRSAKRDAHALGAVIVRGGYPHLLSENTPFEQFRGM